MKVKHAFGRMTAAGFSLLMLTGGVWVSQTALNPPVAQAYKSRVDVTLDRLKDETYQSMMRRAEIVARAAAQRSFDRDILMSEVSVMVIGEYQGAEAPLLLLEVSRQNWRQRPDTRRWATYYRTARTLLKLPSAADPARPNAGGVSAPMNVPNVTPVPQPIAEPQTISPQAVPTPVASPTASPQAVPQTAPNPKALPQPKVAPKPGAAAAKAAEAAAAAEAASDRK